MLYHINEAGEAGECSAKVKCPFGGESGQEDHYTSKEAAREAYEERMKDSALVSKNDSVASGDPEEAKRLLYRNSIIRYGDFCFKSITFDEYTSFSHRAWSRLKNSIAASPGLRAYIAAVDAYQLVTKEQEAINERIKAVEDELQALEKKTLKTSMKIVNNKLDGVRPLKSETYPYEILDAKTARDKIAMVRSGALVLKHYSYTADRLDEMYDTYEKALKRYESRLVEAKEKDPRFKEAHEALKAERAALEANKLHNIDPMPKVSDFLIEEEKEKYRDIYAADAEVKIYRVAETMATVTRPVRVVEGVTLKPGEGLVRGLYRENGEFLGPVRNNLQGINRGFSAVKSDGTRTFFKMPSGTAKEKYDALKAQGFIVGPAVSPVNVEAPNGVVYPTTPTTRSKILKDNPVRGVANFDQGPNGWANTVEHSIPKIR